MTNLIETRDLCRTFGSEETKVTALDHVSINIEQGEFTAIIGPSGSGKTTLLHLIGGLDEPNSGSVTLSGSNIADMSGNQLSDFRRDHIGFIFQAYNLIPVLSAEENIEYIMLLQGISAAERKKRVKEMLELVELDGLGDRRPSHLSGGQQQRVAIARALALRPQVLICDESVSMLDAEIQAEVLALLRRLQQDLGLAMIFVTHDLSVASGFCHRVIVLDRGQVVEEGPGDQLLRHPKAAITRTLVEACPLLPTSNP